MQSSEQLESELGVPASIARRRLILRDTFTFVGLTLFTIALFAVTFFLFQSFADHRSELGRRWSDRGRAALARNQPEEAIGSLRTALTYAPGERSYELLLAEALAAAGHREEALNYFSGLWVTQPGSGLINLQLARLAAARNDQRSAVNFYRSSIYGTWEGDGVARRRSVRLELARYLIARGDFVAARAELLVAEGNAEVDPGLALELGRMFEQAGDRTDALDAYLKSAEADPKQPTPLAAAGRLAFSMGEFSTAQRLLRQALHADDASREQAPSFLPDLLHTTDHILDLLPSTRLTSGQRVSRLLVLKSLAEKRLDSCKAMPAGLPSGMQQVDARWSGNPRSTTRRSLLLDDSRQDDLLQLIFDTEIRANQLCGPATGDDALLVQIARDPKAVDR